MNKQILAFVGILYSGIFSTNKSQSLFINKLFNYIGRCPGYKWDSLNKLNERENKATLDRSGSGSPSLNLVRMRKMEGKMKLLDYPACISPQQLTSWKIQIVSRLYYSEEHSEYALKQQQRFIYVAPWSQRVTLSWDLLKNMHQDLLHA